MLHWPSLAGTNKMFWVGNQEGKFSSKSSYDIVHSIREEYSPICESLWKCLHEMLKLFSWPVPQNSSHKAVAG